jgi:hypothetical protein
MKYSVMPIISSLLSILLFASHWAYEVAHGWETGGVSGFGGIVILLVWLCGTLLLAERRSGYIITLLGGIFGVGVLVLHMTGRGLIGGRIATSSSVFFWVWSLIMLGLTSSFSAILSARGLWTLRSLAASAGNSGNVGR